MSEALEEMFLFGEEKMEKALGQMKREFSTVRTGRANPAILDRVVVDYYGAPTPIRQMAQVSVSEGTTLVITPFDKSILKDVEKAVIKAELGVAPNNDGVCIRLNFPPLTEERRRETAKEVKKFGEDAKIAIRNVRRDMVDSLKKIEKEENLPEDAVKDNQDKIQKLTDKLNGVTRENLTGIRVVRAFNAEKYQEDKFSKVNNELTNTQLFNQKAFAIMQPIMYLVMYFLTLSIYFIGADLINKAMMSDKLSLFSDMVVFSSYSMQVIMSFLMLAMIFMMLPRASVSAKRINEVLDTKLSIKDGKFTGSTKETGTVEFKNVSFKYPDAEEYLLKDISFKANKGETVAFIGSTGSGKSSLINLIPRFYDATDGEVLVDGVDVKEYKQESLRNKISYVPQKATLFHGTVSSNVSFGDNGKGKINTKKIEEAVRVAQAEEFVSKMDKTYDAAIAQGGTNVSGGQKQRLSIARAVARDPEIYIFDDSFSALDYKTDYILRKELKNYTKDATSLIVAQRIGTIMNADKILVLDNGKCVGMGTHKELLKTCDVYKQIALSQLSKEELENA